MKKNPIFFLKYVCSLVGSFLIVTLGCPPQKRHPVYKADILKSLLKMIHRAMGAVIPRLLRMTEYFSVGRVRTATIAPVQFDSIPEGISFGYIWTDPSSRGLCLVKKIWCFLSSCVTFNFGCTVMRAQWSGYGMRRWISIR